MPTIELSAGPIDCLDTGGDGPVVLPVHGLIQDATLWGDVVADLRVDHRCVVPTLPLGAHRAPMAADADLSIQGQARLIAELIDRLDLHDVTLVANDWGGPLITAVERPELLARLVLTPCEAFDNLPPGLPGRFAALAGRVPGGIFVAAQALRLRPLRRMPTVLGRMIAAPIPHDLVDSWVEPLRTQRGVRRDLVRYIRTTDDGSLDAITGDLARLAMPVLVAWTTDDLVMPAEHGPRLADLVPDGRYVEISDSRTLVPLDQPTVLARLVREFAQSTPVAAATPDAREPGPHASGAERAR